MPKPKIKYDWYQTETHVIVTILAKNTENAKVDYGENTVCIFWLAYLLADEHKGVSNNNLQGCNLLDAINASKHLIDQSGQNLCFKTLETYYFLLLSERVLFDI